MKVGASSEEQWASESDGPDVNSRIFLCPPRARVEARKIQTLAREGYGCNRQPEQRKNCPEKAGQPTLTSTSEELTQNCPIMERLPLTIDEAKQAELKATLHCLTTEKLTKVRSLCARRGESTENAEIIGILQCVHVFPSRYHVFPKRGASACILF